MRHIVSYWYFSTSLVATVAQTAWYVSHDLAGKKKRHDFRPYGAALTKEIATQAEVQA